MILLIYCLQINNIWSTHRRIPYTLKSSSYIDLDFSSNQNAVVLPYQLMGFWQGGIKAPGKNTENFAILNSLAGHALGAIYHNAEIEIEVWSVCRQRLLQQGTTTTLTYDFETSQNLIIGTLDRYYQSYTCTVDTINTWYKDIRIQNDVFRNERDYITKEEIPQRHTWHKKIHFPQYNQDNIITQLITLENNDQGYWGTLIPGRQSIEKCNGLNISNDNNLITYKIANSSTTANVTHLSQAHAHPLICLAQPKIPDETGLMKFRYQIRVNTKLHLDIILRPDIWESNMSSYVQTIPLPIAQPDANGIFNIPCVENHIDY